MFCQFWRQNSEITVSAGLVPCARSEGEPVRHTLLADSLPASHGGVAFGCVAPVSVFLSLWPSSLCLFVPNWI